MNGTGSTRVKWMLVVTIICTLAAITIPRFEDTPHRVEHALLPVNVDPIKTMEIAHTSSLDQFLAQSADRPDRNLGRQESACNEVQDSIPLHDHLTARSVLHTG